MNLKDKKVTIFGFGVSGVSACKLCLSKGAKVTVVNQSKPESSDDFTFVSQNEASPELFSESDYIILSPGIAREHDLLKSALGKVPIINEIELAIQFIPKDVQYLATTGTNGKTTTVSLIDFVLKEKGIDVFTGGNIGTPLCEYLLQNSKAKIINLELSSFQLESIDSLSPKRASILNVFDNHGERYSDFKDYQLAKENIAKKMGTDQKLLLGEALFPYQKFNCETILLKDFQAEFIEIDMSKYILKGDHNKLNIMSAYFMVDFLFDSFSDFEKYAQKFKGVEHRLEFVSKGDEISFYNDAKSTNWLATMTALKSFPNEDLLLIVGGQRRGEGDLPSSEQVLEIEKTCKQVLCFGESAPDIKGLIQSAHEFKELEEAILYIKNHSWKGVVLFSPAFPSFDQFKNYSDRGETYKSLIEKFFA
ncbi:MAG: UDP-N-acetylmuramoyl-L-alanine--D-glutamate ligase [Oligoflexia bacterium]|nr:UDP-N-acetylmuramoyl-L-alanine--D-glutamate ligase [Oligoflexia bacterium]